MKRILTSLMALVVGTTATTSVVACSNPAKMHTLKIKIGDKLTYSDYDEKENLQAYNGTGQTAYRNLTPLDNLIYQVWNLISFDYRQVINPQKIPEWRSKFVGTDDVQNEKGSKPSVDGVYFKSYDDPDVIKFYSNYEKTSINSLGGLYQLYSSMKGKDINQIGLAAQESFKMIEPIFDSSTGYDFINSFLSLNNQSYNSSWLSVTLSSDTQYTELDSKILPFNVIKTGENEKTTEYQFKPEDGDAQYIGKSKDFLDVNTKVKDEEGHEDEKIGNRYKDPFSLLILPPKKAVVNGDIPNQFKTDWKYPEKEEDRKKLDGNEYWDIRTPDENGEVDWKINVAYESDKEEIKGYIKTNDSVVVPLEPVKLQFTYTTDTRNSKAVQYFVNITLDGLQAVFRPVLNNSKIKDDEKIANRYAKWQFTHYQFTNQVDYLTNPWKKVKDKAGFGFFSGMKILNFDVQLVD